MSTIQLFRTLLFLGLVFLLVQGQPQAQANATELAPDGRVTFRIKAPQAEEVSVSGELPGGRHAMTKDERGVWSVTLGPLAPELYTYSFTVDGLTVIDPANPDVKPQREPKASILNVPGVPPLMHEFQGVPHGTVHIHHYASDATGSVRRLHVYTPSGYGQRSDDRYPVLYLFHGSGDNDATWTVLGHAQWILDNLIAQGKAVPMVVVMTDGHAAMTNPSISRDDPGYAQERNRVNSVFQKDLLEEVMPLVDANYRVRTDSPGRAIIGLSMGGAQSLSIGLTHPELFAWVGGMSSALREPESQVASLLAGPAAANAKFKLIWFACGKDDRLVAGAREFHALLDNKGITHTYRETDGAHQWMVWRKYLAEFAPLLFKD